MVFGENRVTEWSAAVRQLDPDVESDLHLSPSWVNTQPGGDNQNM